MAFTADEVYTILHRKIKRGNGSGNGSDAVLPDNLAYIDAEDNENVEDTENPETGWIKNEDGEKFAPKTVVSQVLDENGESIKDKILPKVSAEDNDKFLRVVNGAWSTVSISPVEGVSY